MRLRALLPPPAAVVLPLTLLIAACGTEPPAPVATTITISPTAPRIEVGASASLTAAIADQNAQPMMGTVSWRSSDAAVATVGTTTGQVVGVSPGTATITAAVEGRSAHVAVTVVPVPVASVTVVGVPGSLLVGQNATLLASTRDRNGGVLTGRLISWQSNTPAIATLDSSGVLRAVAAGTAQITATSEGIVSAVASVTVLPIPVASVALAPATALIALEASVTLTPTLRDAAGTILTGRTIAWASSVPTVASVQEGVVRGLTAGTTVITAISEGIAGSAVVTVAPPGTLPPAIAIITPATLVAGENATITGTGFIAGAGNNRVTVGGVAAAVVTASTGAIVIAVPCVPTATAVAVHLVSGSQSAPTVSVPVTAPRRSVAAGQALILDNAQARCTELQTGAGNARYLVAVYSAATSSNTLVDFELTGNPPPLGEPTPLAARLASRRAVNAAPVDPVQAARDRAHWAMLERNRVDYEVGRARTRGNSATAARAAVPLPAVGDIRSLFFTFSGGCADVSRIVRGRAIYVGTRGIIWEDSANVLQSSADPALAGFYDRLGRIFDQDQYDVVRRTFADPLVRDAVTDADGRVHMVFTQRLNGTGAAAYVTSCDQFPTTTFAGSNFGQFFYGTVPTLPGSNLASTAYPDGWFNFMARTVVHEVKHIASLSARVANGSPTYESGWLEEGTARHAEEVWVRGSLHNVPWKGNTGWGSATTNGLYCDFHPESTTCNSLDPLRRPSYGMRRPFNELREKLVQPWNWSIYGDGTGQTGSVFYQTVWSLVRYAIDRHGASDEAFLTALTNATTAGLTNLTTVSGTTSDRLLGGWGLALFADDYPGLTGASPDIQYATWNFRNIYAALNADPSWSTRFNRPYMLQPAQLTFGAFTAQQLGMRGGAHTYFEVSGAAGAVQMLGLQAPGGGVASTALRVAITRLQ